MKDEGWARVNYVMELVKSEGDAECEAAFDDLLRDVGDLKRTVFDFERLEQDWNTRELLKAHDAWFREAKRANQELERLKAMRGVSRG